ncbi:MAG: hypothetical protein ACTS4Z_02605 [Candidatus Hodgkinia cicadicola]
MISLMSSFDRLLLKTLKYSLAFTLVSFVPFEVCYLVRTFRLTFNKLLHWTLRNNGTEAIEAFLSCLDQS